MKPATHLGSAGAGLAGAKMVNVGDIASILVAAGTAVLAFFTWRLAKQTRAAVDAAAEQADVGREQVKVSERQAQLAAQAQAAAVQPTLVDVPIGPALDTRRIDGNNRVDVKDPTDNGRYISVPLRNIGPGVAIIRGLNITATPGSTCWGSMSSSIVAVGEVTRFTFEIPRDRPEFEPFFREGFAGFSVTVAYSDISGEQRFKTRADVHTGRLAWHVRQVFLFRGDDVEPFAGSGPADG